MNFEQFCEINVMTPEEVENFKAWLTKRKDDMSNRSIQKWLADFNLFFDAQ